MKRGNHLEDAPNEAHQRKTDLPGILKHLELRRRSRQGQGVAFDPGSVLDTPRGRRAENGLGRYALRSRLGVLICAMVLILGPARDAAAAGELDPSTERAASHGAAELRTETRSQWNLQIERKWRAGNSTPYKSLGGKELMVNLPSGAVEPALVGTHGADQGSRETLRSYVGVIERPPAAAYVVRARQPEVPVTDVVTEAATPSDSEAEFNAPMDFEQAVPATEVVHHDEIATSKPMPTPEIVRQHYPEIRVTQTVWHPRAARRLALVGISGRAPIKLQEGDRLGLLAVGTIEPSGVAFNYDGVEIRCRLGDVARKIDAL
jgi:hypothetical protein